MFLEDLREIRSIRKKLGLTQKELAEKAGVSQSMIAKIESGLLEPTYKNALKILNALEKCYKKRKRSISEVMTKKIISTTPNESISSVIKKMSSNGISQLPVFKGKECVGLITETTILNAMSKQKKPRIVEEIMEPAPPIINKEFDLEAVIELLKYTPIVLIKENNKNNNRFIGVITKSDLIKNITQH